MKLISAIFVMCIVGASCSKPVIEKLETPKESFSFGTHYGMCGGNCASFFMLKDGKIYGDEMEYFSDSLRFSGTALADDKYKLAKNLSDNFPAYMAANPDTTFGCPDCHDQGGIYIEYKENGKSRFWRIDTDEKAQPVEVRDYVKQMMTTIQQLSK